MTHYQVTYDAFPPGGPRATWINGLTRVVQATSATDAVRTVTIDAWFANTHVRNITAVRLGGSR